MAYNDVTTGANVEGAQSVNEELQMTLPCQAGVKAHLLHLVCPPHEEVDDAISYYTIRKSVNNMVVARSYM